MTGDDQQGSLWASYSAREPQGLDDVVASWEPDEPDEASAPPANAQRPGRTRAFALGVLATVVVVALAAVQSGGGSWAFEKVPSYWGDVPMTCETTRLEQGDRALEVFRCRAVGGGTLPPGVYRSPTSQWTSDITRRDARANGIRISPDGEVTGWAAY